MRSVYDKNDMVELGELGQSRFTTDIIYGIYIVAIKSKAVHYKYTNVMEYIGRLRCSRVLYCAE